MSNIRWVSVISLITIFFLAWELNRSDNLGVALWTGYVALSVVTFTSAWVTTFILAVVWVCRMARRGYEEEKVDVVKSVQNRMTVYGR